MENMGIIAQTDKKSPVAEAYRTLRTNIKFCGAGKELKVVLLTSATAGAGKTTTCANLAAVIAQNGQRALVVDCDMRNPSQHEVFGLANRGLSDCLAEAGGASGFISETAVAGVDVLPAGTAAPNPAELLASPAMEKLLGEVAESYDYVLLDAPPVLPVPDALELSARADGVILVVCAGMDTPEVAGEAKLRLEQVGAKILGVVLNKAEEAGSYGCRYYYAGKKEDGKEAEA